MKKVMFCILLVMLGQDGVFAEKSEVFPLSDITIGMSSKTLLEKYSTEEILFSKKDNNQILEQGGIFYDILTNQYWSVLCVNIDNAKVKSLCYLNDNPDNVVKNINSLFNQLKQQLGTVFEKQVACFSLQQGSIRCATYIWKRGEDMIVFSHSPVSQYKKGDDFVCQVVVMSQSETLCSLLATDSLPEDALLWADAMGEERGTFPNLWVYACVALCVFCAIAYFIRKKRQ